MPLAYAWEWGPTTGPTLSAKHFANDPDELLAVQGKANEDKGDSPPGEWMPPNVAFDCGYATTGSPCCASTDSPSTRLRRRW